MTEYTDENIVQMIAVGTWFCVSSVGQTACGQQGKKGKKGTWVWAEIVQQACLEEDLEVKEWIGLLPLMRCAQLKFF